MLSFEFKPPKFQAAFTLLELVIVIVILTILVAYIQSRPDSSGDYHQDSVIQQLISAGQLTQQLSMNDSARSFSLEISSNQIDLLAGGVSFDSGTVSFPINLPTQVSLAPTGSISFDSLGRTTATTISVQANTTKNVCFVASGYIQQC